jgi:NADP-dependent 3-hydroxy acid dehydrogenase YdfG
MTLEDSVAIVTGASSGIGEATAKVLGREGCAVALVARREERLEAIADGIDARTLVVPTDVSDEEQAEAMVEEVRSELGEVDVLVNNAGIARGGPVGEADLSEMRRTVRVNLEGVMNVTHAAMPSVREAGGDVITVSSLSARFPQEGGSAYTASKFGVNGFCKSLRKEVSDDDEVRVSIVMPGPVITELNDWEHWDGRAMDPEDVGETVAFVCSRPDHVELGEITIDSTEKF